jgi:hypothetical protein
LYWRRENPKCQEFVDRAPKRSDPTYISIALICAINKSIEMPRVRTN